MRSLKEFLEEEGEKPRTVPPKGVVMRDEWIAAVDRLMDQVLGWIAEADPKQILTIEERTVEIREEMIGTYEVRALTIILESARRASSRSPEPSPVHSDRPAGFKSRGRSAGLTWPMESKNTCCSAPPENPTGRGSSSSRMAIG